MAEAYFPVGPGLGPEENFLSLEDILMSQEKLPGRVEAALPRLAAVLGKGAAAGQSDGIPEVTRRRGLQLPAATGRVGKSAGRAGGWGRRWPGPAGRELRSLSARRGSGMRRPGGSAWAELGGGAGHAGKCSLRREFGVVRGS
uniref:Uncharacterized protein n=1 Tax=Gopherus agassizii TaxID=38772 RepID=A0A452GUS3_9SAUR